MNFKFKNIIIVLITFLFSVTAFANTYTGIDYYDNIYIEYKVINDNIIYSTVEGGLKSISITNGKLEANFDIDKLYNGNISAFEINEKNNLLIASYNGSESSKIQILNYQTGELIEEINFNKRIMVRKSLNNYFIVSAGNTIYKMDFNQYNRTDSVEINIFKLGFGHSSFAYVDKDSKLKVIDYNFNILNEREIDLNLDDLSFYSQGNYFVASDHKKVYIYNFKGNLINEFDNLNNKIFSNIFIDDNGNYNYLVEDNSDYNYYRISGNVHEQNNEKLLLEDGGKVWYSNPHIISLYKDKFLVYSKQYKQLLLYSQDFKTNKPLTIFNSKLEKFKRLNDANSKFEYYYLEGYNNLKVVLFDEDNMELKKFAQIPSQLHDIFHPILPIKAHNGKIYLPIYEDKEHKMLEIDYKNDEFKTFGELDNIVSDILIDSNSNKIYVSEYYGKVYQFDLETLVLESAEDKGEFNKVYGLTLINNELYSFTHGFGLNLSKFDPNSDNNENDIKTNIVVNWEYGFEYSISDNGRYMAGHRANDLIIYDLFNKEQHYKKDISISDYDVTAIDISNNGKYVLFGTAEQGVFEYYIEEEVLKENTANNKFTKYLRSSESDETVYKRISFIDIVDSQNEVIVTSEDLTVDIQDVDLVNSVISTDFENNKLFDYSDGILKIKENIQISDIKAFDILGRKVNLEKQSYNTYKLTSETNRFMIVNVISNDENFSFKIIK